MNAFDLMLSRYNIVTNDDYTNAVHEVMQQITLAGMYRGEFFTEAAFYGGTCLRIFHGLNRFSEDMDFSLMKQNPEFTLENYFEPIMAEFRSLGREVSITKKKKSKQSNVESAFLKEDSAEYNLSFTTEKAIKIKIEVDVNPPLNFSTESKILIHPFSFMVRCFTLPSLFAGKMHALLFRGWKNRVKGRDWYDFEWYVRNNIPLDLTHLQSRTEQCKSLPGEDLTSDKLKDLLRKKIQQTDIEMVKADVSPFLHNLKDIELWSTEYFLQLVNLILFD